MANAPADPPGSPLELRVEIEREARRMAGYWHGKRIAETFLTLPGIADGDPRAVSEALAEYLQAQDDPRLTEIMRRLEEIYLHSWRIRPESVYECMSKISVYQLRQKFVNRQEDIPEDARQVVYYALAVGHHVGVMDCFTSLVEVPLEDFRRWLAALPEGPARSKLAGVLNWGEIEINRSHAELLLPLLEGCRPARLRHGRLS